ASDANNQPAAKLEQALLSELPQSPKHGVGVDATNCRQVPRGRQSVARPGVTFGDRAPDARGDLIVECSRVGAVYLDAIHGASHTSVHAFSYARAEHSWPTGPRRRSAADHRARSRRHRRSSPPTATPTDTH